MQEPNNRQVIQINKSYTPLYIEKKQAMPAFLKYMYAIVTHDNMDVIHDKHFAPFKMDVVAVYWDTLLFFCIDRAKLGHNQSFASYFNRGCMLSELSNHNLTLV